MTPNLGDYRFNLVGRVALVTGAGGGIGRPVALALGQARAFVGIH
jgi:NAD(P)-dependent dehydrogenase (short-subunit alcohol dehydrogenase family)